MKLFEIFKNSKQLMEETEFVRCYKCLVDDKNYKIILTKKIANKYTIIHCQDNTIFWQQIPRLVNWGGKMTGEKYPVYKFSEDKNNVVLFVIKGKPNGIIGLDEGVFCCADNFNSNFVNVMSYRKFKKL